MKTRTHERCGRLITTFDQSDAPPCFFVVAKALGYRIAVTGGVTLTHEIEASADDVQTICDLAWDVALSDLA